MPKVTITTVWIFLSCYEHLLCKMTKPLIPQSVLATVPAGGLDQERKEAKVYLLRV
jgi:hypothetical protein